LKATDFVDERNRVTRRLRFNPVGITRPGAVTPRHGAPTSNHRQVSTHEAMIGLLIPYDPLLALVRTYVQTEGASSEVMNVCRATHS